VTALNANFEQTGVVDFGPIRMTTRQLWGETARYSVKAVKRRLGRQ
jgi:hypothetical protein